MKALFKFLKSIVMFIWQLPQNLLGLMLLLVWSRRSEPVGDGVYAVDGFNSGVSLGDFIFLCAWYGATDLAHEYGHREQSKLLGPVYLLVI